MITVSVERFSGVATVDATWGPAVRSITLAPAQQGGAQIVSVPAIGPSSGVVAPTVRPASVRLLVEPIAAESGVVPPTVRTASIRLQVPATGPVSGLVAPVIRPATRRLSVPAIEAASALAGPSVRPAPVRLSVPAIAATSGVYAPSVARGASWYESAEWNGFAWIADFQNDRYAVATGLAVGGVWPKRAATIDEILTISAPAGRGYIPETGLPYAFDTAADAPRFDWYRGHRQLAVDPLPRFNRLYPSAVFDQPITIVLLQWPYVFSFFGDGYITCEGDTVPGGYWELRGEGADEWVWGIMPHDASGEVTITPHGDVRFALADTHGVGGDDPLYPTAVIPTTTERVDRAEESIAIASSIVSEMAIQGTILVQGQFYAPGAIDDENDTGMRCAIGYDERNGVGITAAGNVRSSLGYGTPMETPLGVGGNGDPFRIALSFMERDDAGGFQRNGFLRFAGNGGTPVDYSAQYSGGIGAHTQLWLGRDGAAFDQTSGAGGYDLIAFSPDVFTASEVQALSVHPDFVASVSPTFKEYTP